MVRSPRTHRRWRGWPLTAGLVVVLSGATAANAIAATQSWTIVANRSSVPLGTPATVTLTIVNTSSEKGGGAGIGCVAIAIPAAYTPTGVSVVSVTSGLSWTAGLSASAPRGIKATAASNGDRLQGDPIDDVLVLQVHVNGRAVGSAAWTANEFQNSDCSGSYRKPVRISMSVVAPAVATPRPTAQPTARPTPTPAPQATTPATPTASPSSTPPGATSASGASSTPATPPSPGSGRSGGSTGGRGGAAVGSTSVGGSGDSGGGGPNLDPRHELELGVRDPASFEGLDLGGIGFEAFEWTVPGIILTGPGLLLLALVAAQAMGGLAWLPVVRRKIGAFGPARGPRPSRRP